MNKPASLFNIVLIVLLINFPLFVQAQVVVERSNNKAVIAGVAYFIHLVKKGETPYSISRAYGITTEILEKANPSVSGGIKEGQILRIPVDKVSDAPQSVSPPATPVPKDEKKYIYHKLQPGETIYSLSRRYNVSENDIIQSNPSVDIRKLPLGYEIAVPRRALVNKVINHKVQETRDYYHSVVKGETLYSIARRYGITVRDLRRGNRDIRFPQVGDSLRIPGMKVAVKVPLSEPAPDSIPVTQSEDTLYLGRPSEYTPVAGLTGTMDVAVLLPFYLDENAKRTEVDSSRYQKGKRIYTVINRPVGWVYPGSLGFVEMYEGILLATDTLRSLGLDINLHVHDIKSDTIGITNLIKSGQLDKMDLIIGPVHSRNLTIVAEYVRQLGIPVVSPVQLFNNSVLTDNPMLFMASSSLEVAQNAVAKKVGEYYDRNIVLVHSDTTGTDSDIQKFKNMILTELKKRAPEDEIRFKEFLFYSRSVFGTDSIDRLSHVLSDKIDNVVIIASDDAPVMIEAIQDVHNLSRKFKMDVFGYPEMRQLINIDPRFFFELGLVIYTPYWIDYSDRDVKKFCSDFMAKFRTQPSEMSYAWEGYDIAYYFLSGLAIHGKDFLIHPEVHNPDLLYTGFDFRRKSAYDGFENQKLFLVRYSNDYELKLLFDSTGFTNKY